MTLACLVFPYVCHAIFVNIDTTNIIIMRFRTKITNYNIKGVFDPINIPNETEIAPSIDSGYMS